jgi:hypothetical protein
MARPKGKVFASALKRLIGRSTVFILGTRRPRTAGALVDEVCTWHKGDIAALQQTNRHSITSSERASNSGGAASLSAFAVLRLITNSTLLLCWIGRSAGFAPLRIFPT